MAEGGMSYRTKGRLQRMEYVDPFWSYESVWKLVAW